MKKFNKNCIVFVAVIIIIMIGFSKDLMLNIGSAFKHLFIDVENGGDNTITEFTERIEKNSSDLLSYHDMMMDVNSLKDNLMGTRIVSKDSDTVVKADTGSLVEINKEYNKDTLRYVVDQLKNLQIESEKNNAEFLYCAAPSKEIYEDCPSNVVDHSRENMDNMIKELSINNIPFIDLREPLDSFEKSDLFFFTDHHWRPRTAFLATNAVLNELHNRYGFTYNTELTRIDNYDIEILPNWFLGSYGKKVGTFFTWHGADDFEVITPKFETEFSEFQPYNNEQKQGEFKDVLLYREKLEKNIYRIDTYSTYGGGNYGLQIIKNMKNKNGIKVLLVRDSFACTTSPFLSLHVSELHICDLRGHDGTVINVIDHLKQIRPNYVIVQYSNLGDLDAHMQMFDFNRID